ncbi:MAG TPA: Crp/Fnr family transcriptional regulator [Methylomirabilota bacterium]|nr:Crp/Fnr family transcriptional regulator [Methylomirabilota bacterium]
MKTNATDRIAILKSVALFADLSEKELGFLAERSSVKQISANELIFSEGDPCQGLFIVQSGAVKIFKMAPNGREQVLGIERTGNSVAELPVFDGGNYPASTIAVEDSALLFVRKEDFRALCLEHPEVALKVLRVVGRRLRGLVGIIEELSFTTVRQRLVAYLLRISGDAADTKKSVELLLPVSHQELAAELGTVRELVSRNLSRLQAEGLIKLQARSVQIPDLAALRAACEPTG